MTNSINQAKIAILTRDDHIPWHISKTLFQHQIEFNYVHEGLFAQERVTFSKTMNIANQQYESLILDGLDLEDLNSRVQEQLIEWTKQGGQIFSAKASEEFKKYLSIFYNSNDMITELTHLSAIRLTEPCPDIRVSLVEKNNLYFYLLVNEGEERFVSHANLSINGKTEVWDPWSGEKKEICFDQNNSSEVTVNLERRSSVIFVVDPDKQPEYSQIKDHARRETKMLLTWQPETLKESEQLQWKEDSLYSWTQIPSLQHFSGTIHYPFSFDLNVSLTKIENIVIDIGEVYEIAELYINNQLVGTKFWAPYILEIPLSHIREGDNELLIKVTNNSANEMDQTELPSGLIGPVEIKIKHN